MRKMLGDILNHAGVMVASVVIGAVLLALNFTEEEVVKHMDIGILKIGLTWGILWGVMLGIGIWIWRQAIRSLRVSLNERRIRRRFPGGIFVWPPNKPEVKYELPYQRPLDPRADVVLRQPLCHSCGTRLMVQGRKWAHSSYYCPACSEFRVDELRFEQVDHQANQLYRSIVLKEMW